MSNYNDNLPSTQNKDMQFEERDGFNLQLLLVKFLIHWPWFVVSVVVCVVAALVHIRYNTPIYRVDGAVLITEETRSKPKTGTVDLQNLGIISMTNNFDNEVEILQSRSLVKKVVRDLGLYVEILRKRSFASPVSIYKNCPLEIYVSPEVADTLPSAISMQVTCHPNGSYDITTSYSFDYESQQIQSRIDSLPAVISTAYCDISLTANPQIQPSVSDVELMVSILPLSSAAGRYMASLSVEPRSKTTTIAQIVFNDSNRRRGVDFVNSLVYNYNRDANTEKNQVAQKTAEFIDERIGIISRELGHAENQLADFKQSAGLTNLTSDAQLALSQNAKYEETRIENATQIRLVEHLQSYVSNPANADEVIPANVGLSDINLSNVISQYNDVLLERKRLQRTTSDSNPAMQQANAKVEVLHHSVEATIASTLKGLRITQADLELQSSKYQSRINSAPRQEKEYLSISRQQEIMATLYTLLLQKREENAITLAATANNGRLIEEPQATSSPVFPNRHKIVFIALALGVLIPFLVFYILELLKYKIENQADIEMLTDVPMVAEVPAIQKTDDNSIVVRENHNGLAEEAFRALRTNLVFMLKPEQKVIMFTSTQSNEGKSFIAANTALSMAILGKKVLVVGMDIRKPGLNKTFGFSRRTKGVTEYLRDPDGTDLQELILSGMFHPNLDVLPGGTIPPNPTELVARDGLDRMMEQLKQHYDYILLDTAPIGMVADTAIVGRVVDVCLYVCRADFTPKAGFQFINRLADENKFQQLGVVLNGFDTRKRKNSNIYARRYGYGYGYGSSYGYGYGYNEQDASSTSSGGTQPS